VNFPRSLIFGASAAAGLTLTPAFAALAAGQVSSLYGTPQDRAPLTLAECSWTFQPPEEPKVIKLQTLLTVVVSETAAMTSNGQMDRKKQAYGDLSLPNWIKFYGTHLGADKQNNGEPHIRGELDNKLQSQADLQTKDTLKFKIACRVIDIRPNGNLLLDGSRLIKNNEENWEYSLTGEIRADAILPNNTVLSESVADLKIVKRELGHVRDGYRRGWALEWLDKWQPF